MLTFRMRHLSQLANGKFLYRRAIPQRLRPLLGKREFKRILGSTEEDALRAYPSYHRYIDDTLKTLKPLGQAKDQVSFSEVRKAYDALGLDTLTEGTEDEFDFLSDDDEAATKLDLAYAYQKMGDVDGAREILEEVMTEGNESQVTEAKSLLGTLEV